MKSKTDQGRLSEKPGCNPLLLDDSYFRKESD